MKGSMDMIMQMMHTRLLWSPVNMNINMIQRRRKKRIIMQRQNMAMTIRMTMSQLRDPGG